MYKRVIVITSLLLISGCSTYSERNKSVKWLTPDRMTCYENGGNLYHTSGYKYNNTICSGLNLKESKKVCSELGRVLPSLDELKQVAISCGIGNYINGKWKNTKSKKSYYSCFEKKGFAPSRNYITSTVKDNHVAMLDFGQIVIENVLEVGEGVFIKEIDISSTSNTHTMCKKK